MDAKKAHKQSKRASRDAARPKGKPFPHGGRHSASTFQAPRLR